MNEKHLRDLPERFVAGSIATILTIVAVGLSHTWPFEYLFLGYLCLLQGIALWEYYHLARLKDLRPLAWIGIIFATLITALRFFSIHIPEMRTYFELLFYLFGVVAFVVHFKRQKDAIANLGVTLFGFFYIAFPLSLLIDINYNFSSTHQGSNFFWLLYVVGATKFGDMVAYFVGRRWGTNMLCPHLSPQKTFEGAIGGLLGSMFFGLFFYLAFQLCGFELVPQVSTRDIFVLSLMIGFATIVGDLAESLLKRDAQAKDSNAIPGLGGILDMIDSLLFTTPLVYLFLRAKLVV